MLHYYKAINMTAVLNVFSIYISQLNNSVKLVNKWINNQLND